MNVVIDDILAKSDVSVRVWALNLRGLHLADELRNEEADTYYDRAIKLDPRFGQALVNKGLLAARRGDYQAAINHYRKAHAINPDSYLPLNNWGVLLGRLEDFDEAIIKLQQAILRDPNRVLAHGALGSVFEKMNDLERAATYFERAFQLEPTNVDRLRQLGTALYRNKEPVRADEHFKAALLRLPHTEVHNAWGEALAAAGHFHRARAQYRRALDASPDDVGALTGIGRSWLDQRELKYAEASCQDAIRADESSSLAHLFCGDVYRGRDNSRSLEHYSQARKLSPSNADVLVKLAGSYYANGQPELGALAYQRASTISPADKSIYLAWASWLLSEQDYEGALNKYDASIRVFPANEDAYEGRSIALQCLDEMKEASKSRKLYDILKTRKGASSDQDRSVLTMFASFTRFGRPVPP